MIMPFDDTMAVILDDTYEVWPNCPNLILCERFVYFIQEPDPISAKFTRDNDVVLYFMSELLTRVHWKFYSEENADIKSILNTLKLEVLSDCKIAFSGIIPLDKEPKEDPLWKLAESFGATCQTQVNESTTHLIASVYGTKKTQYARRRQIPILHRAWLDLSTSCWHPLPEAPFTLDNIGQLDMFALLPTSLKRRLSSTSPSPYKKLKTESGNDSLESQSDSESESDFADLNSKE